MNKIIIITFVTLMGLSFSIEAQEKKDDSRKSFDRESFLVKRSAYITAELGLTPEEAAAFMPLCDELQKKKFEAGQNCRKLSKDLRANKNPADADYLKVIDECVAVGVKEAELEKEYYEKFKKVLPPGKLYKFRDAEFKFAREFMRGGKR